MDGNATWWSSGHILFNSDAIAKIPGLQCNRPKGFKQKQVWIQLFNAE